MRLLISVLALLVCGQVCLADQPPQDARVNQNLERVLTLSKTDQADVGKVPFIPMAPMKERLQPAVSSRRSDSFGNNRVDIAPKSWPYPMVVSPGRPVLPGSAW